MPVTLMSEFKCMVFCLIFFLVVETNSFSLAPDNISPLFRRYDDSIADGCAVHAQTWILTSPNDTTSSGSFHRFFDSSPFSPSGRYIGFTRTSVEGVPMRSGMSADVVVIDLVTGREEVVARTAAWDTQLGAQVQWGETDDILLYNAIVKGAHHRDSAGSGAGPKYRVAGVRLQLGSRRRQVLPCSVYHVSDDGTLAVTPKLSDMHLTQGGYGAYLPGYRPEIGPPSPADGVHVMNLTSGACRRLISLPEIARYLGLPATSPLYGFHVKFTSDNKYIMVVVRNLVLNPVKNQTNPKDPSSYSRRGHIVVIDATTGEIVTYVLSFVAAGARPREEGGSDSRVTDTDEVPFRVQSGNHPNWIHGTYDININLLIKPALPEYFTAPYDIARVSFGSGHCLPGDFVEGKCPQVKIKADGAYFGSGHHVYLPGQRFVLVDAYMREGKYFKMDKRCSNPNRVSVPLRLVDLKTNQQKVLVEVPVFKPHIKGAGNGFDDWRCDLHPAPSRDSRWVAINGRPDGGWRQLMVTYIGDFLQQQQ